MCSAKELARSIAEEYPAEVMARTRQLHDFDIS